MSTARNIALALAVDGKPQRLPGGDYLVCCPVPSHGKGRGDHNPSLRLADGDTCLLVHCYAGCAGVAVLDALRRRGLIVGGAQNGDGRKREDDDRARKHTESARGFWNTARDPRGTLVEDYLHARRLVLDDAIAGRVLRFHPRCPYRSEFLPALIAVFRSLDDDTIKAIHRIRLDQGERWPKAERRMFGPVGRAAIKLDSEVGDTLAIGEGIETCMAARVLGIRPTWALGSAGGIAQFPVLPGINTLRILAENCPVNEDAVEQCGLRWHAAGRRVRVIRPTDDCKDLNDVLLRGNIP